MPRLFHVSVGFGHLCGDSIKRASAPTSPKAGMPLAMRFLRVEAIYSLQLAIFNSLSGLSPGELQIAALTARMGAVA
jgi:hypothetical protein